MFEDSFLAVQAILRASTRRCDGSQLSYKDELAERAGVCVSYISMIERAGRLPHIETLAVLAKALGLTLSQLFLDVGPRTKDAHVEDLPLLAYLGNLRLRPADVDALLKVAKAIFDG